MIEDSIQIQSDRDLLIGEKQSGRFGEWAQEGSLKLYGVGTDGNSTRYQQSAYVGMRKSGY